MSNRFFDWVASASRFISYTWARASEVNASLDNVSTGFELVQDEIDENKTRSIRLPVGQDGDITAVAADRARRVLTFNASGLPYIFPPDDAATRANKVFAWDASGNPILASNGAPYAWLPTQTGNNRKILTTDGSNPSWIMVGLTRLAKTTTASLGADDNRTMVDCSGTFTVTFAAPATLETGWYSVVRNTGTGDITVSHTSGNIDGLTSYIMYPGEARLFQCDGSTIRSQVLNPYNKTYTSGANTFTKPPGYAYHEGELWGGGGGGSVGASAPGGGGGACTPFKLRDSVMGSTEIITIGAGGTGSATGTPSAGSASTIGSLVRAGGAIARTTSNGGTSLFLSTQATALEAIPAAGFEYSSASAAGGPSIWGGGAGDSSSAQYGFTVWGGAAGAKQGSTALPSVFGGAGGAPGTTGVGSPGAAPGGGGGATNSGANGGAGASGECRIRGVV